MNLGTLPTVMLTRDSKLTDIPQPLSRLVKASYYIVNWQMHPCVSDALWHGVQGICLVP